MTARACIAIVSYNSEATLPRCLAALAAQTVQDFRVVVIDNASRTPPAPLLEGHAFPIAYRALSENLGFAGGMNTALEMCDTPYFIGLNPDAFPEPTWLARLLDAATAHPEVAAFGSVQRRADDATRLDGYGDHYLIFGQAWRGTTWPGLGERDIAPCFGVCAAAALYRTTDLRRIGGFDVRFFCFYEDVDVSFRLRLAGMSCAVVPTACVTHIGGASFEGLSDFAAFLIARNQWWVLVKNMPAPLLLIALPGFLVLQVIGVLAHPKSSRMKGLWAGLRETGKFMQARRDVQGARQISLLTCARWLTWNPRAFLRKHTVIGR